MRTGALSAAGCCHRTQAGGQDEAEGRGKAPGRVSEIEWGGRAAIEALSGKLDLIAKFGDHAVTVTRTEAA